MTFGVWNRLERYTTVLVVVAHPDDAEARAGGTIARLTKQATKVHLIVCTDGSKGTQEWHPDIRWLVARRRQEQLSASSRLHVEQTHFLGHVDGELENTRAFKYDLVRQIRLLRPELIITHDPWALYQLHPDHRATGFATCDAVMAAGGGLYYPELAIEGLAPHHVGQLLLMASTTPNVFINIEDTIIPKLDALACHVSQGDHQPAVQQRVYKRDQQAGQMVNIAYAEPFRCLTLDHFTEKPVAEDDTSVVGAVLPVDIATRSSSISTSRKLTEVA